MGKGMSRVILLFNSQSVLDDARTGTTKTSFLHSGAGCGGVREGKYCLLCTLPQGPEPQNFLILFQIVFFYFIWTQNTQILECTFNLVKKITMMESKLSTAVWMKTLHVNITFSINFKYSLSFGSNTRAGGAERKWHLSDSSLDFTHARHHQLNHNTFFLSWNCRQIAQVFQVVSANWLVGITPE